MWTWNFGLLDLMKYLFQICLSLNGHPSQPLSCHWKKTGKLRSNLSFNDHLQVCLCLIFTDIVPFLQAMKSKFILSKTGLIIDSHRTFVDFHPQSLFEPEYWCWPSFGCYQSNARMRNEFNAKKKMSHAQYHDDSLMRGLTRLRWRANWTTGFVSKSMGAVKLDDRVCCKEHLSSSW